MNTNKLKTYAPKARRDFIAAVTRRAAKFGLTAKGMSPSREEGQLVFIEGQPYPRSVGIQRRKLADRMAKQGFDRTLEAAAYTWFNRLAAIRYMELHGYLDHSFRVLSPSPLAGEGRGEGANSTRLPEILDHAQHVELPGLDRQRVIDLKMDGTRDEELYRDLLLAQCHALHQAMPFLFERLDDETELLLPDNLLQTDSLIRELVTAIPEQDWQEIEIIGWLYQFYISEKKDQVIGKVVKSEDIPAATQLFTPNWIVKYKVQNSLGAQWLATYPDSPLKGQMAYYIEPAEQTPEVQAQLDAITPSSLNPEELTLMDPACGSGHILVEGYDLFKAIYLERGYRPRDVAKLILEKNLFGLDIDARAAQLAGFALMMKARADDWRLFERDVKLNVLALVDSAGFDAEGLAKGVELGDYGLKPGDIKELKRLFEHATTFGSLIQVPEGLAKKVPSLKQLGGVVSQDLFVSEALNRLGPLVQQAELLASQYDAVVANPPYMGGKFFSAALKKFARDRFPDSKRDLFACFIERGFMLAKQDGRTGMVTMQSWMFLSSFRELRERMLREKTITAMAHIGFNSFPSLNSKIALATVCSSLNRRIAGYVGTYSDLNSAAQSADKMKVFLEENPDARFRVSSDAFRKIPGSPVAYWVSEAMRSSFALHVPLHNVATPRAGMITGDNSSFVRTWPEVSIGTVGLSVRSRHEASRSKKKWFPYQKGGEIRKWSGNREFLVDWQNDGERLRTTRDSQGNVPAHAFNEEYIFQPNVNWSAISIFFSARITENGSLFDAAGSAAFPGNMELALFLAGFLNSKVASQALGAINPTVNFQAWNIGNLPLDIALSKSAQLSEALRLLHSAATIDWDAFERSWDFQSLPLLGFRGQGPGANGGTSSTLIPNPSILFQSYTAWITQNRNTIAEMQRLEEQNNRLFIDAYGLADELTPEVPIEQITLTVNPAYRYGRKVVSSE